MLGGKIKGTREEVEGVEGLGGSVDGDVTLMGSGLGCSCVGKLKDNTGDGESYVDSGFGSGSLDDSGASQDKAGIATFLSLAISLLALVSSSWS